MFAKVIVDISNSNVDKLFTYSVPEELELRVGHHVLVPFGRGNKPVEGFVLELCEQADTSFTVKPIIKKIEPYTVLLPEQIELADWITRAYHCTRADALRVMIPAKLRGSRIKEKTVRTLRIADGIDTAAFRASMLKKDGTPRSHKQLEVFDLLASSGAEFTVFDINAYIPGASAAITALIEKGAVTEAGRVTFRSPFSGSI